MQASSCMTNLTEIDVSLEQHYVPAGLLVVDHLYFKEYKNVTDVIDHDL